MIDGVCHGRSRQRFRRQNPPGDDSDSISHHGSDNRPSVRPGLAILDLLLLQRVSIAGRLDQFERIISIRGNEVSIHVGQAKVTLKPNGEVTIEAASVIIHGHDPATVASGLKQIDVHGSQVRVVGDKNFSATCGGDASLHSGGGLSVIGDYQLTSKSKSILQFNGAQMSRGAP